MPRRTSSVDKVTLRSEYDSLRPALDALGRELGRQLDHLVVTTSIRLAFPMQTRVKAWASIAEKLDRVPLGIERVIDLQDLVGFRLILLFRRDMETVMSAIEKALVVSRAYDTAERLKADQFGYSSVHLVVEAPPAWLAVPTFAALGKLKAEVQVRTLSQHLWAEASAVLQYKKESSVPTSLRRGIHRVSALLEMVDLEFDRVLSERSDYVMTAPLTGDSPLNVDLLQKVLDELLPAENKDDNEDYSEANDDLLHLKVTTVDTLRELVAGNLAGAVKEDGEVVKGIERAVSNSESPGYKVDPDRQAAGVFYSHVGLLRIILGLEFGDAWKKYAQRYTGPVGPFE